MSVHSIHYSQRLPISLAEAWDFLSSPNNLSLITPPHMGFIITSPILNERMYAGQIIAYKVKPVADIPVQWVSEISQVNEPTYFVDEQRSGPYALWHHQHLLREVDGGVMMEDIIHYKAPFGLIGDIANALFIRRQLNSIFEYRRKKLEEFFPANSH